MRCPIPYFLQLLLNSVNQCITISQWLCAPQHQHQGRGEQKVWRRGDIIPMSLFQFKMQRIESLNSCNRSFDPGLRGRADPHPWFIETSLSQNISAFIFRAVYGHDQHQQPVDYRERIFLRWNIAWHSESGIRVPTEGLFSVFSFFLFLDLLRKNFLANWMNEMLSHTFASCLLTVCTSGCNLKSRIIWHKI